MKTKLEEYDEVRRKELSRQKNKLEQIKKDANLSCVGDIPTYILVEECISPQLWTKSQLIDYICFLEDNCD